MNLLVNEQSIEADLAPSGVYFRNLPHLHQHPVALFLREVQGRFLRHVAREKISTSGWSLEMLGGYVSLLEASDGRDEDRKTWLLRHDKDQITLIEITDGWADITTAGRSPEQVAETCGRVATQIASKDHPGLIPITFWALDPEKWPRAIQRKIETPTWAEVQANYSADVLSGMEPLLALNGCPKARMILWHGPSGTGKTHALRALIREWQSWCDIAFITDPERFVGGSPTYLFQVANFTGGRTVAESRRRSKLIVLEDAGELMTTEARTSTGQGLSRLLNLTDGLMGQGLNVMVLITTNEPLSSMHPAVVRPGRCLAEMEFGPLPADQSNRWLREHGAEMTVSDLTPLAELYAIVAGRNAR